MLKTDCKFGEVHSLSSLSESVDDKVYFKSIVENSNGGVSLVSFKNGQSLAEHLAPAEVMIYVVEGMLEFTIIGKPHTVKKGEFILLGNGVPHKVSAMDDSKMMLIKIKP